MSNTKRPNLERRHTPKSEKKRTDDLDQGLRITIDGEVFEVRIGDVTSAIARELRARIGMGFMSLMSAVGADPDVDLLSAFVWVARRARGELVGFDDVEVTYAQILADGFDIALPGAAEVDDPEA